MAKVLISSSASEIQRAIEPFLFARGHSVLTIKNGAQRIPDILYTSVFEVIILDLDGCTPKGLKLLQLLHQSFPQLPVIAISACNEMATVIEATKQGVFHLLHKPWNDRELKEVVIRALTHYSILENHDYLPIPDSELVADKYQLVGKSPQMLEVCQQIGRILNHPVTVLIEGENGTGKELIARIIHRSSENGKHPFIAVNSGGVVDTLIESELFGHVRGAFTGADSNKKGKFELAGKGTIFLDEISETSATMQVKLLRVLQEKEYDPVGGEYPLPLHARIIAATNRNLENLVTDKIFRQDLYYRLNVYKIKVPPLRERKEDIKELLLYFLRSYRERFSVDLKGITKDAFEQLNTYHWPGNVRELEHVLLRAVLDLKGPLLTTDTLSFFSEKTEKQPCFISQGNITLAQMEKLHIAAVLSSVGWNKAKASKLLSISKPTLYQKIRLYGLQNSTA